MIYINMVESNQCPARVVKNYFVIHSRNLQKTLIKHKWFDNMTNNSQERGQWHESLTLKKKKIPK